MEKNYYQINQIVYKYLLLQCKRSIGLTNKACKSGLAVKSGVVESGKINVVKAYQIFGPKHHGC